jgi:hypothetical protein
MHTVGSYPNLRGANELTSTVWSSHPYPRALHVTSAIYAPVNLMTAPIVFVDVRAAFKNV